MRYRDKDDPQLCQLYEAVEEAEKAVKIARRAVIDYTWSERAAKLRAEQKVWLMTDGTRIPFGQLTDEHLQNIIAFIHHTDFDYSHPALKPLTEEAERRKLEYVGQPSPLRSRRRRGRDKSPSQGLNVDQKPW